MERHVSRSRGGDEFECGDARGRRVTFVTKATCYFCPRLQVSARLGGSIPANGATVSTDTTMTTDQMKVVSPRSWTKQPQIPVEAAHASGGWGWYFAFFFISGFCSILYELIWLRLAMAEFGVTTAMISIVLSSFMAGLGVGSLAAGHLVRKYAHRLTASPLRLYAITEACIAISAVVVPLELRAGRAVLEQVGSSLSLSSSGYYVAAGLWLACTLVPWCACMGATIPVGMFAIRSDKRLDSRRSFSFLYLANVLGAVAGAVIPLALVEILGFAGTLQCGMALNLAICAAAVLLASRGMARQVVSADCNHDTAEVIRDFASQPSLPLRHMFASSTLWLLFATGLTSMGMELVWTRQYTPYVGTFVYSFAAILGVYLAAMFIGSTIYRFWSRGASNGRRRSEGSLTWLAVWLLALVPMLTADSRLDLSGWLRVPLGIAAFSALLGFLTPMLVDRFSEGDPNRAGIGYAVNVAGCILGPLLGGFVLLPYLDERFALIVLALPWLLVGLVFAFARQSRFESSAGKPVSTQRVIGASLILVVSSALILKTHSYVQQYPGAEVRRDSTATVIATGQGRMKKLVVNGVSMTILTPLTKMMSALPLTFLDHPPEKVLVICFGMGTTHRSMLSWGIDSTAVDLVPGVPALFGYYHSDGPELLKSPRSHVVFDDGRRFLERTTEQYDVIVIDPPPPIGAAGSSLLYSREFYVAAKKRLRPDGILQQWFPGGDVVTTVAVTRAMKESFPYVRAFVGINGWGIHYLASRQPIPNRTGAELAARMPVSAATDLVEWGPYSTAEQQLTGALKNEISIDRIIATDPDVPVMVDDRPVNEYCLLRNLRTWLLH
jgi:spermidine synthase